VIEGRLVVRRFGAVEGLCAWPRSKQAAALLQFAKRQVNPTHQIDHFMRSGTNTRTQLNAEINR